MTTLHPQTKILEFAIHIRLADEDDIPNLEWYGQYTHYRKLFQRSYREQLQGKRLMVLAICNNVPIGQIFVQLKSNNERIADGSKRAYLYSFRVMEIFQGRGIGTWLIQEAEAMLSARGFTLVTIAVSKTNHSALRLYQRLKYKKFAEDPGRWSYTDHKDIVHHINDPCWILEKKLIIR